MYSKNKKYLSLVLFSVITILVCSCRENPKTTEAATTNQTETAAPIKNTATPVTSGDGVAMNPAHGQPGHRCEIPVGAPLDSKPAPVKTNTNTSDVFLDDSNSTTLPKGTLNPAHGQPGHRCDVQVGKPL